MPKEADKILALGMEGDLKEKTTLPLPKNRKSGKIYQDKGVHFEKGDWSSLAKWSSLGVAGGGLAVHSEREASLPIASSRREGELFSFHSSLDICWANDYEEMITKKQDRSTVFSVKDHKETVRKCQIEPENGNVENMSSSYIPLWSPEIWARARNVKSKYYVSASPGAIYSTSKIVCNAIKTSENQPTVSSEDGVPRKPLSKKYKTLFAPGPNQEKISENLSISARESSESHSTTSTSSSQASYSQGLVHRVHKNGLPYYTFSLNESYQVLVAKTWKANSGEREDIDWIYTFHSSHDVKKTSNKSKWVSSVVEDKNALDLVGRMRVSSSPKPPVEGFISSQHNVQTEFVLFGASGEIIEPANETPRRVEEKSTSYPDQSFRTTTSIDSSVSLSTSETSLLPVSTLLLQMPYPGHVLLRDVKKSKPDNHSRQNSFKPQTVDANAAAQENRLNTDMPELAAIVISQSQSVRGRIEKDVSKQSGGWGLKFLEKRSANSTPKVVLDCKEKPESCDSQCKIEEAGDRSSCVKKSQKSSVTAIVPADVHGLPLTNSTRPSSLIERWRFDGNCDCGGWDLGCPITLLHGQKQKGNEFVMADPNIDVSHSSFSLSKGGKQKSPTFTIEPVDEGLYILTFQSQLSALQAFSICVALLHVGDPAMNESRKTLKDID